MSCTGKNCNCYSKNTPHRARVMKKGMIWGHEMTVKGQSYISVYCLRFKNSEIYNGQLLWRQKNDIRVGQINNRSVSTINLLYPRQPIQHPMPHIKRLFCCLKDISLHIGVKYCTFSYFCSRTNQNCRFDGSENTKSDRDPAQMSIWHFCWFSDF